MTWFLVVSYLGTTAVDLQEFSTLEECKIALAAITTALPPSPTIEKVECLEGRRITQ